MFYQLQIWTLQEEGERRFSKVVFIYIANKLVPIQTREYRKYDYLIAS